MKHIERKKKQTKNKHDLEQHEHDGKRREETSNEKFPTKNTKQMFSLTNRLANSALQRNNYFPIRNGIEYLVQYNRSASIKLTPHDVSLERESEKTRNESLTFDLWFNR